MNSENLNELSKQILSPVPFWFLNGYVDEWHIIREFEMMKQKGINEVIVHPRYGLQVDYLSDGWFEIFGWCVREAKKQGMHVWIYDELNWPSGTAGMTVMKKDPNYQGKHLSVQVKPLSEIDLDSFEPGAYVVAANIEGGIITETMLIKDISSIKSLPNNWLIFNCVLEYDQFYIDTLSWDAVNSFKHVTYDEYYKRFGDEFGKSIRAIFTDEPSVYWVSSGYDDNNIPYTDDYFSTFEARFGYSPAPMIPYLFYPGTKGTAFRCDYWDHAGFLFNERYHGNLGSWCREHGIIYTGHNNCEEPLRYQIRFEGNMFDTMRTMDIPGIDHLGKATLGNHWISIIGHKICSSQTHFSGKARCMSESFGVMEWDTTFINLKRVADWQHALGINLLIPHAIYHTIGGMTKRESPPSFFYQSPHWEDFDYFSDYVKRLEEMLCGGKHMCKVAVMYPLSGLWAGYQSDRKTSDFEAIDNFLNSLCLELVKSQIDFDLIDYRALKDADLKDGRIRLAQEEYEVLLVPAAPYMRQEEVSRLMEIVQSGVNTTFFHKAMEPLRQNLPEEMRGASFVRTEELEAFIDILRKQLDDDIQITGGGAEDIMVYRREKNGKRITFFLNRSEKHRKVTAVLKNYPYPAIFDQETGVYTRLEGRTIGRKLQAQLRFQPNQSYFIISNTPDVPVSRVASLSEPKPIELKNLRVEVPFNTASIYHFAYTKPGEESVDIDVRTEPRCISCNWAPSTQNFEAFAGTYEADIDIDCATDGIRMILDNDFAKCEVYINGTRVNLTPVFDRSGVPGSQSLPYYITDFQDVWADVSSMLKPGKNSLKVVSPTKLSEPLRFIGNFHTHVEGTKVALVETGEVNPFRLELDYPFYSGTVTYKVEFELESECESLMLNLHDVRDTASVKVNGKFLGKRLWAPYTFDIAEMAKAGSNSLEIEIRNNMTNLIYGNPRALGLLNAPSLAVY